MNRKAIVFLATLLFTLVACQKLGENYMPEITFDLKSNIEQTARKSGAPKFQITSVAGAHLYNVAGLAPNVVAHYTRPGFEVKISPIFALTLYADEANHDSLAVEQIDIQIANKFASDKAALSLIGEIVAQFNRGRWKRFIPGHCPAVAGRSVILDAHGEVDSAIECPLDPEYNMTEQEWRIVLQANPSFEWIGDGIHAVLNIASLGSPSKPDYMIRLTFSDAAIKERRERERLASELKKGDAAGWHSTERYKAEQKQTESKIRTLEEHAIRRGDKIVPRS
nr:hypothetical protein [uncultured Massilia sp.]